MDDKAIKTVYEKLKSEIDSLMDNGIDFVSMSKVMHQLVNDFDNVRKNRYP